MRTKLAVLLAALAVVALAAVLLVGLNEEERCPNPDMIYDPQVKDCYTEVTSGGDL